MSDDDRLRRYRAIAKRLLHELAYHIDKDYDEDEIAFLAAEDSEFRTFRKAFDMLQADGQRMSNRIIEVMAKIVTAHVDYFPDTPLEDLRDETP